MNRYKKIRGHNRIRKHIEYWVHHNQKLDLEYLEENQRDYVKVWVPPYRNISVLNSEFSPPRGKTRQKIIDGIFTIYHSWKEQLEKLHQPYYLKIWYFPDDVSKNQVVCAIGDFLNFYETTFHKPKESKRFPENVRGLKWEYRHQEYHVTEDDKEDPEVFSTQRDYIDHIKWVERIMKHPKTRITELSDEDDSKKIYYSKKEYDVWLGGD